MFSTDLDLWHSELPLQRAEIPAGLAHCFYCLFQFETFQWNFQRYIAKVTFQIKMHQAGQESSRVFSGERERKCPHGEWRKHKAGSALSFMEVLLWTSVGGGFGPLFKHLLRDSGSGKLSLSVVLPWVCWEQKCPGAQPHIVWLLCSWGPQGKPPAQLTHCKHLENVIDELAEVWDGWENNLFIGGRLLGCYSQPCCNSFGLSRFDGCCVPSQGVATPSEIPRCEIIELLNELLFCHLPDSECSVVNLGAEIHQCIPSPSPSCYSDSGVCGSFRCKAGAELCSCHKFRELRVYSPILRLLSWILVFSKVSFPASTASWNSRAVPLCLINFPALSWQNVASVADVS